MPKEKVTCFSCGGRGWDYQSTSSEGSIIEKDTKIPCTSCGGEYKSRLYKKPQIIRWGKGYYYVDSETRRRTSDQGCFITTAACGLKGLPDDCRELVELRNFRDNYLLSTGYGRKLVDDYYKIAPIIVAEITSNDLYFVWGEILKCLTLISLEEYQQVVDVYSSMVSRLAIEKGLWYIG